MKIMAIDPGIHTGIAIVEDDLLVWCHWDPIFLSVGRDCDIGVIERPQVYPSTNAKQANDLITLAIRVGHYSRHVEDLGVKVEHVLPVTWKGNVPKPAHHRRMRTKLSSAETIVLERTLARAPKGYHLDIQDAICLGLWRAGRLPKSGY